MVSIVTSVRMINCDNDAGIVIRALCSSSVSQFISATAVKLISLFSTELSYKSWIKQKLYRTCNLGVQLAQQNPQSIPIFFILMQISSTNALCFRNISLRLQIPPSKTLLVVDISDQSSSQPPSNQTSSQSALKNR